ncbi:MAG: isochorismatase family protein [Candidatus Dormibacteria bacterium]
MGNGTVAALEQRPTTALLVIYVQHGVAAGPYKRDAVVANTATLVDRARREQVPVVWVQHSGTGLEKEAQDWRIVSELTPGAAGPLVERTYGDSFEDTTLEEVLSELGVRRLLVTGVETGECIRSTERWPGGTTRPW